MRHWLLVMLLYLGLVAAGCGQKGPLFIPEKAQPAEAPAPAQAKEPPQP